MNNLTNISSENLIAFKKLVSDLENFKKVLENLDYIRQKPEFFETMNEVWKYFSEFENSEVYAIFRQSSKFSEFQNFFYKSHQYYVRAWETYEAVSILTNNSPLLTKPNIKNLNLFGFSKSGYLSNANELSMVNMKNVKNIVLVGSGPMPHTLIFVNENTKADNILGIDNNPEAVYIASEILKALDLPKIQVLREDGIKFNYSNYDLIFVSDFVSPKSKIIDRIVETSKDSVQIIARTPTRLGNLFNENLEENLNKRLKVSAEKARHAGSKSLLLKKF
ncbi:MAG: hypothetical protein Fur0024_1910 [Patescibacteria group bacterium]